jgi:hypothetical protein
MKMHRFVLVLSIILLIAALILPVITAFSFPNSTIYWGGLFVFLSPSLFLIVLLILFEKVNYKQLLYISVFFLILQLIGIIFHLSEMVLIFLYISGAMGILISKREIAKGQH